LTDKVIGDNAANADYQGEALGDLYAGSSPEQLAALVDKWFQGGDLPAADASATYVKAKGMLYGPSGVPQYTDVVQGWSGDCYFLASLAEIAYQNPGVLQDRIIDNGDGTYTIGFNRAGEGEAAVWDYVTVNGMFPATIDENGTAHFAYANNGQ